MLATRRFITARNGNIQLAEDVILQHLRWRSVRAHRGPDRHGAGLSGSAVCDAARVNERIDGILEEDFSDIEGDREMYWEGSDVMGHPVLVRATAAALPVASDSAHSTPLVAV